MLKVKNHHNVTLLNLLNSKVFKLSILYFSITFISIFAYLEDNSKKPLMENYHSYIFEEITSINVEFVNKNYIAEEFIISDEKDCNLGSGCKSLLRSYKCSILCDYC